MRSDVFYWVLNMSILGSLLCLVVLLLRRCKRLPRLFIYGLWALPGLRLLCPVGLTGRFNLMALLTRLGARKVPLSIMAGFGERTDGYLSGANAMGLAAAYDPIRYGRPTMLTAELVNFLKPWKPIPPYRMSNDPFTLIPSPQSPPVTAVQRFMELGALLWLVVAVGLLLITALLYLYTMCEGRCGKPAGDYRISETVGAPAVYGIVRQRILIPQWVGEEELPWILRHERVHLRRRDNLWRLVAVVVCCVHWFNPLCWLCLKYFLEDMELACDEGAMRGLSVQERKDYAHALLNTARDRGLFTSAFGGAEITRRVEGIVSYRQVTLLSALCFGALFAALAYFLLTN